MPDGSRKAVRHVRIVLSQALLDALRRHHVNLQKNAGLRLNVGEAISAHSTTVIEPYTLFSAGNVLHTMGAFSYSGSALPPGTTVGRYCSIAGRVQLMGTKHPMDRVSTSPFTYSASTAMFYEALADFGVAPFHRRSSFVPIAPRIGNDVWIGDDVLFSHGITVGDGAVIAARSIVTHDVPPYMIIGGSPARQIRPRFSADVIARLERVRWWRFAFPQLAGIPVDLGISAYLDRVEALIDDGLTPARLVPFTLDEWIS